MAAVVDSPWQLFALAVSVSGAGSGWLASVVDVGGKSSYTVLYHIAQLLLPLADIYIVTALFFTFVFSVPAINLCLNLGYVSGNGPVQTFRKMAPISSGIVPVAPR